MPDVQHAHFIRLRYHGPTYHRGARISATWEGWPSDGGKPVRVWISQAEPAAMAAEAVRLFCEWLSSDGTGLEFSPALVVMSSMSSTDWAVLVRTEAKPRA